ncbi:Zinc finger CCHC domain-containing protein 8, partial [Galemys pyrenaicus]
SSAPARPLRRLSGLREEKSFPVARRGPGRERRRPPTFARLRLSESSPQRKMAAEVDFGDLELFEAFDPPEESPPKPVHTRFKDGDGGGGEDDEAEAGDAELRARLRHGMLVENTKLDGPLLQILFMNNVISKQYHQEIEEFVSNLVRRFEDQQKNDVEKTSFNLLPQPSSVMLEEDRKVEEACAVKNNKEAFRPRNAARISEKRKEYMDACGEANSQSFQQRYHAEEVEERFGRFKPGVISEELQDALGVTDKSLPPFIYRMRQLADADGEAEAGEVQQPHGVTYDLSKLVNYPGFNISTPRGIPDEWRVFGSIPMQACQQKEVFASYLTSSFQAASVRSGSSKRSSSQSSPGSPKKQKRESSSTASPADMELDSDAERPQGSLSGDAFQFQPPLPRGTPPPIFNPPLPKGTPPLTPSDSPQTRAASAATDEDALTLEELEEQQRRIWAALEQAESVSSDSDFPVGTPLTGDSVASSPCPHELDLPVPEARASEKQVSDEPELMDACAKKSEVEQSSSPGPEATAPCEEEAEEEASAPGDAGGACLGNGSVVLDCDMQNGGGQKVLHVDTSPSTATKTHSPVPDMSKFASGITPFEFENMAESTGMYLRIRNLLKNSPRNQQKNKKASE